MPSQSAAPLPEVIRGACNCGAVGFEITCAVSDIYVCHCSICRRLTGSAGIAVVVVPKASFNWTTDTRGIRTWRKPGHEWQCWFCDTCGSTLPGENDATRMFIPAGLIREGGSDLRVAHHIFVDAKSHWDVIGDPGVQHPEAFGTSSESGSPS